MAAKASAWVGGAALAAVVIGAGAWFGVVAPTLDDAAQERVAAADQRDRNDLLAIQLKQLEADFANLDIYKEELAELRTKVPTTGDLAELTRQLQTMATASGVTLTVEAPGTPAAFVLPQSAAEPEPTVTDDAGSTEPDASPDEAPAPAPGPKTIDGLYTIPLSVTTVGTYPQTVAFLDALQQLMPRLYVVSSLNATSLTSAGASGGRPPVNDGDLETVVSGYVLTLVDPSAVPEVDPDATPEPLPVPGDERNPFLPLDS